MGLSQKALLPREARLRRVLGKGRSQPYLAALGELFNTPSETTLHATTGLLQAAVLTLPDIRISWGT